MRYFSTLLPPYSTVKPLFSLLAVRFVDFLSLCVYNDLMNSTIGNKSVLADNLLRYMKAKQVTRHQLCEDLGFRYSTVSDWIHGRTYPRIDKIEMMAHYFGVTKADLIEAPSEQPSFSDAQVLAARLHENPLLAETASPPADLSGGDLPYASAPVNPLPREHLFIF